MERRVRSGGQLFRSYRAAVARSLCDKLSFLFTHKYFIDQNHAANVIVYGDLEFLGSEIVLWILVRK